MKNPLATCLTDIAITNKTTNTQRIDNIIRMDTDSVPIGIDNCCPLCISHVPEYFVGNLIPSNRKIKGFGGILSPIIQVGTLLWQWNVDQGQEHKFLIPNSLYIPSGKCRLLSQQQWAKTIQGDHKMHRRSQMLKISPSHGEDHLTNSPRPLESKTTLALYI